MPNESDNINAKCPFFINSGFDYISCEGVFDGCRLINVRFDSADEKNGHFDLCCTCMDSTGCPIGELLRQRWAEQEAADKSKNNYMHSDIHPCLGCTEGTQVSAGIIMCRHTHCISPDELTRRKADGVAKQSAPSTVQVKIREK